MVELAAVSWQILTDFDVQSLQLNLAVIERGMP